MRNINTTFASLITLIALVLVNSASAKTYTAINSGKWSDAATWENGTPGNAINTEDEVIIKNHITMNTDVAVSGSLTIENGISVMSNKDLFISATGTFNNKGNMTVKRIINEGTINNNSMIESMMDMENKGTINNNVNMMTGTNLLNQGGNMGGTKGTYFANGSVISSGKSTVGSEVKIYHNPSETATATSTMTLDAQALHNSVVLSVNNPNNESATKFTVERSFDGINYKVISEVTATNTIIPMMYQDKNVDNETIHYKVKVNGSNYLPQATVRLAQNSASIR